MVYCAPSNKAVDVVHSEFSDSVAVRVVRDT